MNVATELATFTMNSSNAERYPELMLRMAGSFPSSFSKLVLTHLPMHVMREDVIEDTSGADTNRLGDILRTCGSDKSTAHNYHIFYNSILDPSRELAILEIGLGTKNPFAISTMGEHATPGASVIAFAEYLPKARVFGADIDTSTLFTADRIRTAYVDQLSQDSLSSLPDRLGQALFDVIIDDGLHAVGSNVNTLLFALDCINMGGYIIIEDIQLHFGAVREVWTAVDRILHQSGKFATIMLKTRLTHMYVVNRIG